MRVCGRFFGCRGASVPARECVGVVLTRAVVGGEDLEVRIVTMVWELLYLVVGAYLVYKTRTVRTDQFGESGFIILVLLLVGVSRPFMCYGARKANRSVLRAVTNDPLCLSRWLSQLSVSGLTSTAGRDSSFR